MISETIPRKSLIERVSVVRGRAPRSEPGVKTVLIGIALLWVVLTILNPRFLTADNLSNLVLQIAAVATLAMGAVLVLLLGEIDLSLGSVSGFAAAIMGVLNVNFGVPALLAIGGALVGGCLVGLLHGAIFTRFGVPSFVVTLGGLLTWQGAQLVVLGTTGNINITDPTIISLTSTYLPTVGAIGLAVIILGLLVLTAVLRWRRRRSIGLVESSLGWSLLKVLPVAIAIVAGVWILLSGRGVPVVVVIVLTICWIISYFLRHQPMGRHVYAIGSNAEAARRTGIAVTKIRILAFAAASTLAAIGGVLAASRLYAVNQSSGQGDILLLAIAGAVIGGVSLFGGVGNIWYALLGSVLIGSIANGMDLLSMPSSYRFVVTGAVLVLAVVVDAIARRKAALRG